MLPILLFLLTVDLPTPLLQQGLLALQHNDLAKARIAFESVTKQEPRNAFAWVSLAETYGRLKQAAAADAAAAKAEKFGGDNPVINHALAIYFTKARDFVHAAQLEQKYAISGRADAEAEQRVANLFLDGGDVPQALEAAQKAVSEHPSALAENVLGRALLAAGRLAEAQTHLARAWQESPDDVHLAFDYVQALLRQQNFDAAADVITKTLSTQGDDAQLLLALGVTRYGQRRFDDAITTFLQVIRIDPQIDQPYLFLGKMLDQAGAHLGEIVSDAEKWAARNPKNGQALLLLAKARLAADAKDATAESLLQRSIALEPRNWESHYEWGVLLEGKRDWPKAAVELKRSAELDEKQAMPHYHLARVYDRLGNEEGAKVERAIHEKLNGTAK